MKLGKLNSYKQKINEETKKRTGIKKARRKVQFSSVVDERHLYYNQNGQNSVIDVKRGLQSTPEKKKKLMTKTEKQRILNTLKKY